MSPPVDSSVLEVRRTRPQITVDGTIISPTWMDRLVELRVRTGLRTIGRASLTFDDDAYVLASSDAVGIGSAITISAPGEQGEVAFFEGSVTSVASESGLGGARLVVVADDLATSLTRTSDATTYHDMSLSDVVRKVVTGPLQVGSTTGVPTTQLPFVLRNGTPLGLIDEIAERYGLDWIVTAKKLDLWDASTGTVPGSSAVSLELPDRLMSFAVRQVGDAPTDVTVRGWDPQRQEAVVGTASSPASRTPVVPTNKDGARNIRTDTRISLSSATEATELAKGIAARTGRVLAQGRALITPELRPGGTVTIDGTGPGNGTYYVREVTHVFAAGGAYTTFVAGDRDPIRLSDPWDQRAAASSFVHTGLVVGVVDGLKDPEALGRVSVSLQTADPQAKSAWARVLAVGAGAGRGQVSLPSVGDEVLVGFENDDVARPVVLGGLFGTKSTAPSTPVLDDGKVVGHVIRTDSGHLIHLSEGQGDSSSFIQLLAAGEKQTLKLGKTGVELTADGDVPLKITVGSSSMVFDGKGAVTIKGSTITLDATEKVVVKAVQTVDVNATSELKLQGATASLKGQGKATVEAGGILEVKGTMVKIN